MTLEGYQDQIDLVKQKIIEQKVPTKYAKGLAILSVLNCFYEGGDALAGLFLEKAMGGDLELIDELEDEAGIPRGKGNDRYRISHIRDAYAKKFQIFRALNQAGITMDLEDSIHDTK